MKEFQPIRYLRRFKAWILILVLVGTIGSYFLLNKLQKYTAQTTLTFQNSSMETSGTNPDGTEFDMLEIKSAEVVKAALEKVDTDYTIEEIRSSLTVSEVIPDDIASIQTGAWEDGLEYEYYPTRYSVSSTLKSKDVNLILSAVIDSYLSFYEDTHMAFARIPERISSLNDKNYDYIEYAEALKAYFDNNLEFLENAATNWSDYRCNSTGYSFEALRRVYQYEADLSLAELFSQIIDSKVTKDSSLLLDRYTNLKTENDMMIAEYQRSIDQYQDLIATYTEKRMDSYRYWKNSNTVNADERVDEVYTIEGTSYSYKTVYDDWLDSCVDLHQTISALEADNIYCNYILKTFKRAVNATDESASAVQDTIATIYARMFALDEVMQETYSSYCDYAVAQTVSVNETPYSSGKLNIMLYLIMAIILLIFFGIVLGVIVGRISDFSEYFHDSDNSEKSSVSENNVKAIATASEDELAKEPESVSTTPVNTLDAILNEYAKKKLTIPFALILFELETNLKDEFESILSKEIGEKGRIAQDDSGRFFCFIEKGNSAFAQSISNKVSEEASERNIHYKSAFSVNSWAHLVDISQLVEETENKLMPESVEKV